MNKPPAFQFYAADFLVDARVKLMTLEERGAYVTLLAHAWIEGPLPRELPRLARLCDVSVADMERIWPAVAPCWATNADGFIINPRLEKERRKQAQYRKQQSDKALSRQASPKPAHAEPVPSSPSPSPTPSESKATHGADAPARQERTPEPPSPEMGRLMGLVRKHLYRGEPPDGWNPARDGSILKRLLASGVSPETTAAAIEGLAILRDWPGKYGKALDWLKPGEKCTMRTLWHTRSGDYQTFQLALNACWKRHNVGKPPLPPTLREVLAKMVA